MREHHKMERKQKDPVNFPTDKLYDLDKWVSFSEILFFVSKNRDYKYLPHKIVVKLHNTK